MTAAQLSPEAEAAITEVVRGRSRRGMSDEDCARLAAALTVPCDPHRGCSAAAGEECRNRVDDGPVRDGFHMCRGKAAGLTWAPTSARDLAGIPKQNDEARARMHYDNTGEDLPGYLNGRRWSPDGAHLKNGGARG